jgi:hypothetical protein
MSLDPNLSRTMSAIDRCKDDRTWIVAGLSRLSVLIKPVFNDAGD